MSDILKLVDDGTEVRMPKRNRFSIVRAVLFIGSIIFVSVICLSLDALARTSVKPNRVGLAFLSRLTVAATTTTNLVTRLTEEPEEDWLATQEEIQQQRKHRISEVCSKQNIKPNLGKASTISGNFIVDDKNKILMCVAMKAGLTFWVRFAYQQNGVWWKKLQSYNLSEQVLRLKKYRKMSFVRHPFHRLWSAYTEKLVNPNAHYMQNYGRVIIARFRPKALKRSVQCGHDVTFTEFIRYIIYQYENKKAFDSHWITYEHFCQPCHINYDFIGTTETFKNDFRYVTKQLGYLNLTQNTTKNVMDGANRPDAYTENIKTLKGDKCHLTFFEFIKGRWKALINTGFAEFGQAMPTIDLDMADHDPQFISSWNFYSNQLMQKALESLPKYHPEKVTLERKQSAMLNAFTALDEQHKKKAFGNLQ